MLRNWKRIGLAFMAFLLVLGSLSFVNQTTVKAADTTAGNDKITIGTTKNTAGMPPVMAKVSNEFANNNVDVDVQSFNSNNELNEAISNGTVNVAVTNLVSYASIVKKNPKWKIAGTLPGYYGLVSNKKYKSIKSLKGKTIAVDKKDGSKQYLQSLLKKNKMKLSSIKIKQIDSQSDRVDSLKNGKIAAAILEDPAISNAKSYGSKILNRQKQNADNGNILIMNTDFSSKNESSVKILINVLDNQIKKINKVGNYTMANDALREFKTTDKATGYMNNMDFTFKKIHKVKKSDFNKAFKYAKAQKLYKGKINYKVHVLKIETVK